MPLYPPIQGIIEGLDRKPRRLHRGANAGNHGWRKMLLPYNVLIAIGWAWLGFSRGYRIVNRSEHCMVWLSVKRLTSGREARWDEVRSIEGYNNVGQHEQDATREVRSEPMLMFVDVKGENSQ